MSEVRVTHLKDSAEAGYEVTGANARRTFWFILWFIGSMVVVLAGVWWIEKWLGGGREISQAMPREMDLQQPLQPSAGHASVPWEDMAALRARQEGWLHSSGALPGDAGHRHISIDAAMDELLKSGELTRPWKNPTTMPYQRPADEGKPGVENRT